MVIALLVLNTRPILTTPELTRMRYILGLILLVFLGAVGLFAFQNTQPVTVKFWDWSVTAPFALVAVGVYLLGMVSGWNVVAFVRSSINRVRSQPDEQ
jgi:lipopolysaccharide assembly protein A